MATQFKIVFSGECLPGYDHDQLIEQFSSRFKIGLEETRQMFAGQRSATLKKGLSEAEAERYKKALNDMGLVVAVKPMEDAPLAATSSLSLETPQEPLQPPPSQNTASPSPQAAAQNPAADNPYAASNTVLNQPIVHDGPDHTEALSGPHRVPISHAATWIGGGFKLFKRNPFAWMASFLLLILITVVLMLIPFVNIIAIFGLFFLYPVILGGYALGAQAQDYGENFTIGHVFSGFQARWGQMVLAGILYLVGAFVLGIALALVFGGAAFLSASQYASPEAFMLDMSPATNILMTLLNILITAPLMMAIWYAPTLIALEGYSAIEAMKLSFIGCWKNLPLMILYGLLLFILSIVALIPVGLGYFVLMPVTIASVYAAYRDIYYQKQVV